MLMSLDPEEHLVIFLYEDVFELEELGSFMEELEAVLKRIVLLEKLRLWLEGSQEIEQLYPLVARRELPWVINDYVENLEEATFKLHRQSE